MTEPWNPWAPPVPEVPQRRDTPVVVLAVAITVLLAAGVVSLVGRSIADALEQDRAPERAASKALDDALSRAPDTATVTPGADGTKRYDSPAPDGDRHAFLVTLPPRWEGVNVGTRKNDRTYSDSALSGPGGFVLVDRLDLGVPVGSGDFAEAFVDGLTHADPPMTVTTGWTATTVGDDEDAFYVEGTMREGPDKLVVRVVLFEHGNETFRVELASRHNLWNDTLPEMLAILDSLRWG